MRVKPFVPTYSPTAQMSLDDIAVIAWIVLLVAPGFGLSTTRHRGTHSEGVGVVVSLGEKGDTPSWREDGKLAALTALVTPVPLERGESARSKQAMKTSTLAASMTPVACVATP